MRWILIFLLFPSLIFAGDLIPRRVLTFWDSQEDRMLENSLSHRTLEMPLNYLGLDVIYYDIQKPLPDISKRQDILGIILCFDETTKMQDPNAFIEWAIQTIDMGKKMVILRNPGFLVDKNGIFTSLDRLNRLYEKIGFTALPKWIEHTFDYKILWENKDLVPFEGSYPRLLKGFEVIRAKDAQAVSYLKVGIPEVPESISDLIIISPKGGFISQYYANNYDKLLYVNSSRALRWYVNPFRFFELVFNTTNLPAPDTTTLAGKRIFYATCHGDGWNYSTGVQKYKNKQAICSEVILEDVVKPHPDLPISVGIIAADIDLKWVGKKKSQEIAKKYFALSHVEAASHTYSHPFEWEFFRTGEPEKEINYLHLYPYGTWQNSFLSWFRAKYYQQFRPKEYQKQKLRWGYVLPRAYANEPFNLRQEIFGSRDFINQFTIPSNPVKLLIWSGDSLPWDKPLELCKEAGIDNQGGGFVRFDSDYPSYIFVFPLARKVGGEIQIYASANADNNYTNGWKDQFYGYQYLPATLKNTENPRRIKPIQLYYHSYSGQFPASVNAILSNIEYIKSQPIIPIRTTRFCDIGRGFFTTEIERLGPSKWKILNRKGLQTIRFNQAKYVNINDSVGVIGYNNFQDSLYVYLDAAVQEPIISLGQRENNVTPYLIESNWEIWNCQLRKEELTFHARGWGKLSMKWFISNGGNYRVTAQPLNHSSQSIQAVVKEHELIVDLDLPYNVLTEIKIYRE